MSICIAQLININITETSKKLSNKSMSKIYSDVLKQYTTHISTLNTQLLEMVNNYHL